jgi:hypothetical protein
MKPTLKISLITAAVVAMIIFASIRVRPYLQPGRSTPSDPDLARQVKVLENAVVHQFDQAELERGSEDLRQGLHRAALAALRALPANHRPDERSIQALASMFADYIMVCRTGKFADYAAWARARHLEPSRPNSLPPEKEDLYWQEATAWARAEPIDHTTVEARTLFVRGHPQHGPFDRVFDTSGPTRELRAGGFVFSSPHDRSVIELSVSVVAPSVDGKSSKPIRIGVAFANDNQDGSWKPITVLSRDVPDNFIVFLPPT